MKAILFLFCFSLAFQIFADVFTLWPYGGKSGTAAKSAPSSAYLQTILGGRSLKSETVNVNGEELTLGITLIERDMEECMKMLKSAYPNALYWWNKDSVLVEVPDASGWKMRIYLIIIGGDQFQVLQFSMKVPEKLPPPNPWPKEIPLAPSSTPITYMKLPARGGSYGVYNTLLPPDAAFAELKRSLIANGWTVFSPAGGASRLSNDSYGDIFSKEKSSVLMTVNASVLPEGGGSRVVIYTRPAGAAK